ncbi:MAG: signal peptidase I [Chloroflexota bacterium]
MRPLRYILSALIGVLIAFGVLVPAASILAPAVGRQVFAIRGQSMSPAIPMGAAIVVVERPVSELRVGDIVTWRAANGAYVTHRVLQVVEEGGQLFVQTQGDANDSPDPSAVPADAIVGVVDAWVPAAGYALIMMSTPTGLVSWLSFGLALLATDALLAGMKASAADAPPARQSARSDRFARLESLWRRMRRPKGTGWPIHFVGITVQGDDLSPLEDMARCAKGDHSRCATEVQPRADAIVQRDGAGARK